MPILVVERGAEKGQTLQVEPGKSYVCGREPTSPLPITDSMASRRHFEIREEDRGFILRDLDSRNGTFLNDEPVTGPVLLRIGDKIQVGETLISFLSDGKEETPQGLVGKSVGGYKILERIGRGGMGTVYKANQLSLNRVVALKVLSARLLQDPDFVDRFKHEARAAGQLNHPNLVQVYDVGTDQGLHYFSMEFMENGSVQDRIGKDGRIPWEEALDMMIDAARGLVFAERNDIVHRDVKPDNLMLTADGSVKIGDLGLATRKEDGESRNARGSIFGTPHFISPEQAQGLEVSHSADLYSLGATFYRVLSGQNPFQGEQVQDIIRQQIQDSPRPLREIAPDVPQAVAAVIERLMRKDPADRYASAATLLQDLEAIRLTHHPALRGGRRGRLGLLVGALVVVVLGTVGLIVLGGRDRSGEPNGGPVVMPAPTGGNVQPTDPEMVEEGRRKDARILWLTLSGEAARLGEVSEENYRDEAWDRLVDDVRTRVIEKYPDTPAADEARTFIDGVAAKRKQIKEDIESRTEAARLRHDERVAKVTAVEGSIRTLLGEERYDEALAAWETAAGHEDFIQDEQAKRIYDKLDDEILREARGHWKGCESEIDRLTSAGSLTEALAKLDEFVAGWNKSRRSESVFLEAKGWADRRRTDLEDAIRKNLVQALDEDFQRFLVAYRQVRRLGEGGDGNQVFAYDFAGAADALRPLLDEKTGLKTWPYRDRLEAKVHDLERMERFMNRFVEAMNAGQATSLRIELEGMSTLARDGQILTPVDRRAFKTEFKRGTLRAEIEKAYADLSPRELFTSLLLEGNRFPLSPTDRLDLALLLAEIGLHDGIEPVLAGLGPVDALPPEAAADARDVLARLEPERRAAAAWAKILADRAASGHDPRAIRERVRAFEEEFARTDLYLLLGGSPPGSPGLVPQSMVDSFLEKLGQR